MFCAPIQTFPFFIIGKAGYTVEQVGMYFFCFSSLFIIEEQSEITSYPKVTFIIPAGRCEIISLFHID